MSVRKSLAWSYGSQAFTFVVNFGSSVVIARLLSPREMGVFAIAMALSGLLGVFANFGVGSYVVREGELSRDLLRSTFTVNAATNLLLALTIFGMGAAETFLLREPDVGAVLMLSALGPLIGLWEFVPTTLYMREMRYDVLSRVGVAATAVTAAVTIPCAYAGLGPISLVVGGLVAKLCSVGFYNYARRADVVVRPTARGLKPVFVFGLQMMSIGGVAQITQRVGEIVLGRVLGLTALGLYSRASNVANLLWGNVYGLATGVIFAKLSRDLRETGELHHTYLRAMKLITAAIWPLVVGLAVLARPAVYILYGEKWLPAALPLSLLMAGQFVALGFGMNWELFVLRRETATQTRFEAIRAVFGLAAFSAGAFFSIAGAAAGRVAESVLGYLLYRPHIDRLAGSEPGELERVFGESLALTAAAVAPSVLLMVWSGWAADTPPLLIAGAVALGVGCWGALLTMLRHPIVEEVGTALNALRAMRARAA